MVRDESAALMTENSSRCVSCLDERNIPRIFRGSLGMVMWKRVLTRLNLNDVVVFMEWPVVRKIG